MGKIIGACLFGVVVLIGTGLLFGQPSSSVVSSGRWQVMAGPEHTILLDTASGETWELTNVMAYGGGKSGPCWEPLLRGEPATQPSNGR